MREEIGNGKVLITNLTEKRTELQTGVTAGKSSEEVANVTKISALEVVGRRNKGKTNRM